jgi:hypothetical protein
MAKDSMKIKYCCPKRGFEQPYWLPSLWIRPWIRRISYKNFLYWMFFLSGCHLLFPYLIYQSDISGNLLSDMSNNYNRSWSNREIRFELFITWKIGKLRLQTLTYLPIIIKLNLETSLKSHASDWLEWRLEAISANLMLEIWDWSPI